MAGLTKRGATWHARIYCDGKERVRSLRTGDRVEAVRKAREIEGCLKGRQWVRPQLQELLERAAREAKADEIPLLLDTVADSLRVLLNLLPDGDRDSAAAHMAKSLLARQQRKLAIVDGWEAWKGSMNRSQPKNRTLTGYWAVWKRFDGWAAGRKLVWLHEVDGERAEDYAADLWESKVTANTFNAHIKFLRSAWGTLGVAAGTTVNPWGGIRIKGIDTGNGRRALSVDEVRRVIGAASGTLRLLLLAGAMTGARLSDLVAMKWDLLDLEAGTWSFTPLKTSRTGKALTLPLLEPLLGNLRAAREASLSPWVFPDERRLWQCNDLTHEIGAHFTACGIVTNEAAAEGSQRRRARILVGFHSLRHFAASEASRSGANSLLVSKALGHGSLDITKLYVHAGIEDARIALSPLAAIMAGDFKAPASVKAQGGAQ